MSIHRYVSRYVGSDGDPATIEAKAMQGKNKTKKRFKAGKEAKEKIMHAAVQKHPGRERETWREKRSVLVRSAKMKTTAVQATTS